MFSIILIGMIAIALIILAIWDLTQKQHSVLRTFPIIGHFRYPAKAEQPQRVPKAKPGARQLTVT